MDNICLLDTSIVTPVRYFQTAFLVLPFMLVTIDIQETIALVDLSWPIFWPIKLAPLDALLAIFLLVNRIELGGQRIV